MQLGLAGDGRNLEAELREDVDGDAADAAGGAGDQDRSHLRRLAIDQHAVYGERGGEAGGGQDHARARVEPVRHGHQPLGGYAEIVGVAAVVVEAQPPAGGDDRVAGLVAMVAGLLDDAGRVDPAGDRKGLDNLSLAGPGQGVFVINAGVTDTDKHFAVGGLRYGDGLDTGAIALVVVVDAKGVLFGHVGAPGWVWFGSAVMIESALEHRRLGGRWPSS